MNPLLKFIIITPVRNEEKHIAVTIGCMLQQEIMPLEWIIVDDGSSDNTGIIVKNLIKDHPFIKYLLLDDRGFRKPGAGVVDTFNEGYETIQNKDYDIVAKFDGDLEFPPNMLESISKAFDTNPKLGIAGGTRYEQMEANGPFQRVPVPKGYVGGPFKFYRKKCFEDIGGLIKRAGWDGVDIIKAKMAGWQTGEIESLKIKHLKPTGMAKGEGLARACEKYGDISYYMGGYLWYFLFRVIGRSLAQNNPKIGFYMIRGYLRSKMGEKPRESDEFRIFLKKIQIQNMAYWKKFLLNGRKIRG